MILKVFSQQLLYTSLEQQGIKPEEEGLKKTQREEMQRYNLHWNMCNPLPLISKGEEKKVEEDIFHLQYSSTYMYLR